MLATAWWAWSATGDGEPALTASGPGQSTLPGGSAASASSSTAATAPTSTTPTTTTTTTTTPPGPPSSATQLAQVARITGDISPKSVVASGHGLVFAQNMMYTHTVSAYRADGQLAATIPDAVDLSAFGIDGHPGTSRGAPVEAAFTSDGRYAYVSNYSMYGAGFGPEASDSCTPQSGYDESFVYRIDTERLVIDQVIGVGSVPKFIALTPDDRTVLVTNWCTWDLSIVDVDSATETARLPIGRYPRGIAVAPDGRTAYVAVMGDDVVAAVDLTARSVRSLGSFGDGPRHLNITPDGGALFVSHNRSGTVVRIDTATGAETHRVRTGSQPRSMAISSDGTALYVANYESSTVTKVATADLAVLHEVPTDRHPIGITYEPTTRSVWVACYGGSIIVYRDT